MQMGQHRPVRVAFLVDKGADLTGFPSDSYVFTCVYRSSISQYSYFIHLPQMYNLSN